MQSLLRQLHRWRFRERLVRVAWGGARWAAAVLAALAVACLADWIYDRYAEVPFALRVLGTAGQVALAVGLAYVFLVRPVQHTPGVDDLAFQAEQAIPEFDHRLVTALQLNRRGAKTAGMSPVLIAEVTREAGEMAARHRLTRLVDYAPVVRGFVVAAPVLIAWAAFAAVDSNLALVLLKRQALLDVEIPRSVRLENDTQAVWPSGAEVVIRYRVTGEFTETMTGRTFVVPDGQPEDEYTLTFEKLNPDGSASFIAKLPPSSTPFSFKARLADGRTRGEPSRVDFEPPPQVKEIEAWQLLPIYLGGRVVQHEGKPVTVPYERFHPKGEVVNALPVSSIRVEAKFNKPVVRAVLVVLERGEGNKEVDGQQAVPVDIQPDGLAAEWDFPTTARTIGYRLELTDQRGFTNPGPFRRGVRMMSDDPPVVEFRKESNRHPDPNDFDGKGDPRQYEWEAPVSFSPTGVPGDGETGPIQVIYSARSELGIGRVNIAYRVIPKGEQAENLHPRDDPTGRVYTRLPLAKTAADVKKVGKWVPDLGLFERSWTGLDGRFNPARSKVQVEFYPIPSLSPATDPGELEAGGRYNFQTGGLRKPASDATMAKLEVGDTVELYVEAFDKYAGYLEGRKMPTRSAGYTREAKRKTIVTEEEAALLIAQRDEAQKKFQEKLREIADDQRGVFQPKTP